MKKIRFIINDIIRCMIHNKYRFILSLIIILVLSLSFMTQVRLRTKIDPQITGAGFFDYLYNIVNGIEPVKKDDIQKTEIPYIWFSLQLLCSFIVLDYVYEDSKGIGRNVLIYSGNRSLWWNSKCITAVISVIFVHAVLWAVSLVFSVFTVNEMFSFHSGLFKELGRQKDISYDVIGIKAAIVLVPLLVSIAISLLQTALSQYVGEIISMLIVISIDVLSVFYCTTALWGNWTMLQRIDIFVENRLQLNVILPLVLLLITASYFLGKYKFIRKDII